MPLHSAPQDELHTVIVTWRSEPFKAHEALSPHTAAGIENVVAARLLQAMVQYAGMVRSVTLAILEQNAPDFPRNFAHVPPSIVRADDGSLHGELTVIAHAPAQLWETIRHHIEHTLEGLHQEVHIQ